MDVKRTIKAQMEVYLKKYPILVLTGPRQSGKTTFLKNEFEGWTYLNLENPDTRNYALNDPNNFLKQYSSKIILDEVQRVPELFSYIQTKVDNERKMGQYIFSGSQNFQLLRNINQSLAGRVCLFKLLPFDLDELKSTKAKLNDYAIVAQKGMYPAIYDRKIQSNVFYNSYIQTYIERDVTELINIKDIKSFRNFITLCATRAGQLLNLNNLAQDCGISQPTAKSWLSVLESSYIVFQLQPYFANISKRVMKTPKLYFYDTGLLCHLLKIKDGKALHTSEFKGAVFENFAICEFLKTNEHKNQLRDLFYWRDAVGHEIDLIWQDDEKLNLVEIKATSTILPDNFKGLTYFENLLPKKIKSKTLLYGGLENQKRTIAMVKSWIDLAKL